VFGFDHKGTDGFAVHNVFVFNREVRKVRKVREGAKVFCVVFVLLNH
jgi:hypothetical protein